MAPTFTTFPRPLKASIVGVPALGVVLAIAVAATADSPFQAVQSWRWLLVPACFLAIVLAEKFPVKIGLQQKISLGALPCIVAALLLPAGIGPATAAAGVLAGNIVVRRTWPETMFNSGNTLTAAALASLIGAIGTDIDAAQDSRATIAAPLTSSSTSVSRSCPPPCTAGALISRWSGRHCRQPGPRR